MKLTALIVFGTATLALPTPQWFSDLRNLPLRDTAAVDDAAEHRNPVILPRTSSSNSNSNFNPNAEIIETREGDVQGSSPSEGTFESKYTHNTGAVPFGVGPAAAWDGELLRLPRATAVEI